MGEKITVFSTLAVLLVLGSYGMGIGDGGGFWSECCQNLPKITSESPRIQGDFTANRKTENYEIKVNLSMDGQTRLLTLISPLEPPKTLCQYTDTQIKEKFKMAACGLKVGEEFGHRGVPVIESVSDIICVTPDIQITGKVVIRIVPVP